MKVYITFKTDNIHVSQTKNPKNGFYKVNFRREKILVIPEIYSYFKGLFEKEQIESVLLEY